MKYAYSNGFILDGSENMEPVSGKVILTNGDEIERIISDEELIGLAGYEKINLGGRYIMPGLVNMHLHLPATGKPKGFMGIKFFENNDCPFYNAETAKKVAEGTKPSAETDFQASTFFYAPNTYYHIESVKSLYRPETTDTRSKSPTSEYRTQTYGIVDRIEDFGVGAILSGKSV